MIGGTAQGLSFVISAFAPNVYFVSMVIGIVDGKLKRLHFNKSPKKMDWSIFEQIDNNITIYTIIAAYVKIETVLVQLLPHPVIIWPQSLTDTHMHTTTHTETHTNTNTYPRVCDVASAIFCVIFPLKDLPLVSSIQLL